MDPRARASLCERAGAVSVAAPRPARRRTLAAKAHKARRTHALPQCSPENYPRGGRIAGYLDRSCAHSPRHSRPCARLAEVRSARRVTRGAHHARGMALRRGHGLDAQRLKPVLLQQRPHPAPRWRPHSRTSAHEQASGRDRTHVRVDLHRIRRAVRGVAPDGKNLRAEHAARAQQAPHRGCAAHAMGHVTRRRRRSGSRGGGGGAPTAHLPTAPACSAGSRTGMCSQR